MEIKYTRNEVEEIESGDGKFGPEAQGMLDDAKEASKSMSLAARIQAASEATLELLKATMSPKDAAICIGVIAGTYAKATAKPGKEREVVDVINKTAKQFLDHPKIAGMSGE